MELAIRKGDNHSILEIMKNLKNIVVKRDKIDKAEIVLLNKKWDMKTTITFERLKEAIKKYNLKYALFTAHIHKNNCLYWKIETKKLPRC